VAQRLQRPGQGLIGHSRDNSMTAQLEMDLFFSNFSSSLLGKAERKTSPEYVTLPNGKIYIASFFLPNLSW
jgi:hypothetical protein